MKKRLRLASIIASYLLVATPPAQAFFPVTDPTQIAKQAIEFQNQAKRWIETANHYKEQLKAYENQLLAQTGVRDVARFVKDTKGLTRDLKNLSKQGLDLDTLLTSDLASPKLEKIYRKYKSFDTCGDRIGSAVAESCKKALINQAAALESTTAIQKQLVKTMSDVGDISTRIENSKDIKESQDLLNVLNAKSIQMNAQIAQWQMSVKQSEQRAEMLERERVSKWISQAKDAPLLDLNG